MDKIAAYAIALQNIELEKRAEYIVENFGTCEGKMPVAYLQAYDALLNKEASLSAVGRGLSTIGEGIGGLAGRAGSSLSNMAGATPGGVRQTLGGALSRAAEGVKAHKDTAALLGAGAVGATGLGVGALGTGFVGGRMTAPRPQGPGY